MIVTSVGVSTAEDTGDKIEFRVVSVRLDPKPKSVEAKTEKVEVPDGVVVKTKRTRRVVHSVEFTNLADVGTGIVLGVRLPVAQAAAEAKLKVEQRLGTRLQQEETYEQEYQLSGDRSHLYHITWHDRVQSGVVVCRTYSMLKQEFVGEPVELEFQIIIASDLKIEAMKPARK